jgi:hypothetical protein
MNIERNWDKPEVPRERDDTVSGPGLALLGLVAP